MTNDANDPHNPLGDVNPSPHGTYIVPMATGRSVLQSNEKKAEKAVFEYAGTRARAAGFREIGRQDALEGVPCRFADEIDPGFMADYQAGYREGKAAHARAAAPAARLLGL